MMKIITKQKHEWMNKARTEMSYQSEFQLHTRCESCNGAAMLMMLIDDDEGLVADKRSFIENNIITKKDVVWPHDCMAIA
ncbi:hypothetical protein LCGC14_2582430, partial [marine sediment metagenome]